MTGETPPVVDPAARPWYDGASAEVVGYITNRGLDKVDVKEAALRSIEAHRNAEQKLGAPADKLLRVPNDAADAEGWNKVWTALGKPKDAAGYDFTAVKGIDDDTANFVRDFAHRNNLPKGQGEALAAELQKRNAAAIAGPAAEKELTVARQRDELKSEWGFNHTANLLTAKHAAEKLGVSADAVAALEGQVGYKAVMQMFHKIGVAIGEDKFVTSPQTGITMTADGAQARIAELKSDKAWVERYQAGDKKAFQEMKDLIALSTVRR